MDLVSIGVVGMARFRGSLNDMRFHVSELLVGVAEVVLVSEVVGSFIGSECTLDLMDKSGVVSRGGGVVEDLDSEVLAWSGSGVGVIEEEVMGWVSVGATGGMSVEEMVCVSGVVSWDIVVIWGR